MLIQKLVSVSYSAIDFAIEKRVIYIIHSFNIP